MARREKTVAFHQLLLDGPEAKPFETVWYDALTRISQLDESRRMLSIDGDKYLLEVRFQDKRGHVVLHKFKSNTDWSLVRTAPGKIVEWSTKQGELLDTAVFSILDFGSVFGHVMGSPAAPRPGDFSAAMSKLLNKSLTHRTVVANANISKLTGVTEATSFELKIPASAGANARTSRGPWKAVRELCKSVTPSATVTISVSMGSQRNPKDLQSMYDTASKLFLGTAAASLTRGSARVRDADGTLETVHAIEYDLAYREPIGSIGKKMAVDDACTQIQRVAREHEHELRQAVGITK